MGGNKMNETKSVKALKKQLAAAIAMVLVAAIALGSSTYAWFVNNNNVTATTTNISAQSNSAYLVIDNAAAGKTSKTSTASTVASERPATTKLYPAQVIANGVWQSAYASTAGASTEKDTTRFDIKSTGKTDGSAEAAVGEHYAVKNTFYIGTGNYDGKFKNLKVESVTVTGKNTDLYTIAGGTETGYTSEENTYAYLKNTTPKSADDFITKAQYEAVSTADSELANAMRVLVKCGNNWVVWQNGKQVEKYKTTAADEQTLSGQATDGVLAGTVTEETDQTVEVYVYYDGADTNVYSDNLADLKDCGVNITFTATPVTYGAE